MAESSGVQEDSFADDAVPFTIQEGQARSAKSKSYIGNKRFGNGMPVALNLFVIWLREEDGIIKDAIAPCADDDVPMFEQLLQRRQRTEQEIEISRKFYIEEAKYRDERAEYFNRCQSQGFTGDDLERLMDGWELTMALPLDTIAPFRRGAPRVDDEGKPQKAVELKHCCHCYGDDGADEFQRNRPSDDPGVCAGCGQILTEKDSWFTRISRDVAADKLKKASGAGKKSVDKIDTPAGPSPDGSKHAVSTPAVHSPDTSKPVDVLALVASQLKNGNKDVASIIRAGRKANGVNQAKVRKAELEKVDRMRSLAAKATAGQPNACSIYSFLANPKRTSVAEIAQMVKCIYQLAGFDLKYEIFDSGDGAVLSSDRMVDVLKKLNESMDSFYAKLQDEETREYTVFMFDKYIGPSLLELFKNSIVTNHLLMEKDQLYKMVQRTISTAERTDAAVKARSFACWDPAERDLRLNSDKFQSAFKEFLLINQKIVALPDMTEAAIAKAKFEMQDTKEDCMEAHMMERVRKTTRSFYPEEVFDRENIKIYEEILEKARDFDFVVYPERFVDPVEEFKKAWAIFKSGDAVKTPEEYRCVDNMLKGAKVPTKIALLCLLGRIDDSKVDKDMEMRQIMRTAIRDDFITLLAYYDDHRDDVLSGGGINYLQRATGTDFGDLTTNEALRGVRQLNIHQLWEWLVDFQIGRARIDTDIKLALGDAVMVDPRKREPKLDKKGKGKSKSKGKGKGKQPADSSGSLSSKVDLSKRKHGDKESMEESMQRLGLNAHDGPSELSVPTEEDVSHDALAFAILQQLGEAKKIVRNDK